jgi:hypothetical protein
MKREPFCCVEDKLMRNATAGVFFLVISLLPGCKSTPPRVSGKWHGATQLTATFTTAVSNKPHTENFPADFVLVLTQTGQSIHGDASVTASKAPPLHIPIGTGVIEQDGKISLEGDGNSTFSRAHLSFDGKAQGGKIIGTVDIALNGMSGSAENKGALMLEPAN